jgi:hypothetical protein
VSKLEEIGISWNFIRLLDKGSAQILTALPSGSLDPSQNDQIAFFNSRQVDEWNLMSNFEDRVSK